MKKYIIVALLSILSTFSYSQVTKTVSNVLDSTKEAIINATTYADTSSNFKRVYNDMKSGITALASSLKIGAEHVYSIIVKQQIVISISYIVLYLILFSFWFICFKLVLNFYKRVRNKDDKWYGDNIAFHTAGALPLTLCIISGITFCIMFGATIIDTISGLINPEYNAIQDIVKMVHR